MRGRTMGKTGAIRGRHDRDKKSSRGRRKGGR